jgi:hypothetical protein
MHEQRHHAAACASLPISTMSNSKPRAPARFRVFRIVGRRAYTPGLGSLSNSFLRARARRARMLQNRTIRALASRLEAPPTSPRQRPKEELRHRQSRQP